MITQHIIRVNISKFHNNIKEEEEEYVVIPIVVSVSNFPI